MPVDGSAALELRLAYDNREWTQSVDLKIADPGIGPRARDGLIPFGLQGFPTKPAANGAVGLRLKFQNASTGDWRFALCKYVPLARYFSLEARGPGGERAKHADGPPFLENQDLHPHEILTVPPGEWQEMEIVLAPGRDGDDEYGYIPGNAFPVLGKKPGVYRLAFTLHGGYRTPVGKGALDVRLGSP